MVSGYNTNVQIHNRVYHVQTEVIRGSQFIIASHIYSGGTIIHSQKTSFVHLVGTPDEEKKLNYLVENQHRKLLSSLRHGPISQSSLSSLPIPPEKTLENDGTPDDRAVDSIDVAGDHLKDGPADGPPDGHAETLPLSPGPDNHENGFVSPELESPSNDQAAAERKKAIEEQEYKLELGGSVSSPDIKHSAFLQKIKIQTDKMKSFRVSRPEKVSSALNARINAILEEANHMIHGIRFSGVVISGSLTALETHAEVQVGPTFTDLLSRSIPIIEQFLDALADIGDLEENILTFQNNRLYLYCLGKKQLFVVLVDRARPIELVRNACHPCIRRLQEALRLPRY